MTEDDVSVEAATAPESHSSGLRRPWLIVAVAVAVVAVAIVGVLVLGRHSSSSKSPALTLEPAGSAGENPFTDSVAVGTPAPFPAQVVTVVANLRGKFPTSAKTQT